MSGPDLRSLASGVERFLTGECGWEDAHVEDVSLATAGARRINARLSVRRWGAPLELVATVIPTAHVQIQDVSTEAACVTAAHAAGVPVPRVIGATDDDRFAGGPFFLSTFVEGETVPRRVLRLAAAETGLGARLAEDCGRALARLHSLPAGRWPTSSPGGVPSSSVIDDAIGGLADQVDDLLQPSAPFALGLGWLADHPPADDRRVPVHGDFRTGNLVVGADGLRAVLDWEAARLGAPMADVSWMCVRMWRFGNDDLAAGGLGTIADLRRGYEEAGGGWDEEAFRWWLVAGTLRWGLGLAHQARQHLDGEFRSIVMAASGRRVAELEYDLLRLLEEVLA